MPRRLGLVSASSLVAFINGWFLRFWSSSSVHPGSASFAILHISFRTVLYIPSAPTSMSPVYEQPSSVFTSTQSSELITDTTRLFINTFDLSLT